jgi:hypothetical protein
LEERVVLQSLDAVVAEKGEVPEHDAADQLAQDRGLAEARRQPPSQLAGAEHEGQAEKERDHGVVGAAGPRGGRHGEECRGDERQPDPAPRARKGAPLLETVHEGGSIPRFGALW